MTIESFLSNLELQLGRQLLENGYVICQCEEPEILDAFHATLIHDANEWLRMKGFSPEILTLENSHQVITPEVINDIRLYLFGRLNSNQEVRRNYFRLASTLIQSLVGNELAMQNKVNLSIQQPQDQTSVLELHSDVWNGDSPFQVVLWVPFTNAAGSNAMFLLPPADSREAYRRTRAGELKSMSEVDVTYSSKFKSIEIRFGQVLLFDSNCLHGNRLNTTTTTRWSMNCRFSSLLAPATTPERRLGSYYTPIMVRPATQMGLNALEALGIPE